MQFEYGLDQRVPFLKSLIFGIQWAALLVSSIIILGKVISGIHYDVLDSQIIYLQKLIFLSAVTLLFQVFSGHKLPLLPGPSAVLLIGAISSRDFGVSSIYSSVMIGGIFLTIIGLSGLFRYVQMLFTKNIIAVILIMVAISLIPSIQDLMIDSSSGVNPLYNMSFSIIMTFLMLLSYRLLDGIWKSTLIIWAIVVGSLVYFLVLPEYQDNKITYHVIWFRQFFQQMNFHLTIHNGVLISFIFCFIALSINDVASIQSVNEILKPDDITKRITRGISITGIANIVSGLFGVIGPVNYSMSPGVLVATRCASRYTLIPAAIVLFLLSFSPVAIEFIGSVPSVIIGAVLAYVMSTQVAAGLVVAFSNEKGKEFRFESGLVIGLSFILSILVSFLPDLVIGGFPDILRPILGNGFVIGVLSSLVLEHIIFRK